MIIFCLWVSQVGIFDEEVNFSLVETRATMSDAHNISIIWG
jgi:hypothetical protein